MTSRPARTLSVVAAVAAAVLVVAGFAWIVTTYITAAAWPVPGIGNANLLVGIALGGLGVVAGIAAVVGLVLTRR